MDLAASIQLVTEEVMLRLSRSIAKETGLKNLCLAGGVALNCVANGKILRGNYFKNIWIQPASGDAGGALGAALAVYYMVQNSSRNIDGKHDSMMGSYLGPSFSQADIEQRLIAANAKFEVMDYPALFKFLANEIATGKAIGWFQGRMEFGPRALGGRSILGDPRSPVMQKLLNLKVKYRESFRPFAPSVLSEDVSDWFDLNVDSPYMLIVADIVNDRRFEVTSEEQSLFGIEKLNVTRSQIPAVTHVDYSARIQTVHKESNPLFYGLISSFKELTGFPLLINTSFNIRGEPIVCSPEDAFRCFMGTEIDVLVVGNCLLRKEQQDLTFKQNYQDLFELD